MIESEECEIFEKHAVIFYTYRTIVYHVILILIKFVIQFIEYLKKRKPLFV